MQQQNSMKLSSVNSQYSYYFIIPLPLLIVSEIYTPHRFAGSKFGAEKVSPRYPQQHNFR